MRENRLEDDPIARVRKEMEIVPAKRSRRNGSGGSIAKCISRSACMKSLIEHIGFPVKSQGGIIMATGYFNPEQLAVLYEELDRQCAEFARVHGYITAAQRNQIAARLMEAAKRDPPPKLAPVFGRTEPDQGRNGKVI